MSKLMTFDDSNFETEVLKSTLPVLVEFGATWCGPCKRQLPILEELAKSLVGVAKVGKVDIDDSAAIASRYQIMSVPTLLVVKEGQVVSSKTGLTSLNDLKTMLGVM